MYKQESYDDAAKAEADKKAKKKPKEVKKKYKKRSRRSTKRSTLLDGSFKARGRTPTPFTYQLGQKEKISLRLLAEEFSYPSMIYTDPKFG